MEDAVTVDPVDDLPSRPGPPSRGPLVAVSGVDGSGKSTLVEALRRLLVSRDPLVISALKPQGPAAAATALLGMEFPDAQYERWKAQFFALTLVWNDRTIVQPALDGGRAVIADRWALDHVVNQEALGVDPAAFLDWTDAVTPPDLHVVLVVDPATARGRVEARRAAATTARSVGDDADFIGRAAEGFRRHGAGARRLVLDGTLAPDALVAATAAGLGAVLTR